MAGVHQHQRRSVISVVGIARSDDAKIINRGAHTRKDLTDFYPALTTPAKRERRCHQIAGGAVGFHRWSGARFSVLACQLRFWVECVHLRKAAVKEQKDDMLCA